MQPIARSNAGKLSVVHRLIEGAIIILSLALVCSVLDIEFSMIYWVAALSAALLFAVFAETTNLYGSWRLYAVRQEIAELLYVGCLVALGLLAMGFVWKMSANYSRVAIAGWALAALVVLVIERLALRYFLRSARAHGRNTRSVAIAGTGPSAVQAAREIQEAASTGLIVRGFYGNSQDAKQGTVEVAGDLHELIRLARAGEVDYIYIALPLSEAEKIQWLINVLADTTVSVFLVPDLFIFNLKQARWSTISEMPVVSIYETPFDGVNGWLKRGEDLVLGTIILAIAAIPMALIALAIKLTSPGPVLFRQRRYGLNGRVVEVLKFRSMTVTEDGANIRQAQKGDERVTPLGAFLRKSSLDELPQFFNVLKGDMSIVGPRPHAIAHNEQYRGLIPGYMLRHKVKPGITGLAQVNGWRGETDTLEKMEKRVEHDLQYIRNWTLMMDLKIIALTVVRGFVGKNAY